MVVNYLQDSIDGMAVGEKGNISGAGNKTTVQTCSMDEGE